MKKMEKYHGWREIGDEKTRMNSTYTKKILIFAKLMLLHD